MTRTEALDKLFDIFHKTRVTKDVPIPPEVIHAILKDAGYYDQTTSGTKTYAGLPD